MGGQIPPLLETRACIKIRSRSDDPGFSLLAMKLHVDHEAYALYLRVGDSKVVESEEVAPGVVLDYDGLNQVVGIEMLHLSPPDASADGEISPILQRVVSKVNSARNV